MAAEPRAQFVEPLVASGQHHEAYLQAGCPHRGCF